MAERGAINGLGTGRLAGAPANPPSLFGSPIPPLRELADDHWAVKALLMLAIRYCGKSRAEIAKEMTELMRTAVTVAMLDHWTAETKEKHRFPLAFARAFCRATGNYDLLKYLARGLGYELVNPHETFLVELGQAVLEGEQSGKKVAALLARAQAR